MRPKRLRQKVQHITVLRAGGPIRIALDDGVQGVLLMHLLEKGLEVRRMRWRQQTIDQGLHHAIADLFAKRMQGV